jgi:hypothetical protein
MKYVFGLMIIFGLELYSYWNSASVKIAFRIETEV